ncbi:response regulator transcription factor [Xenophilus arseniciresistens]|uniref:Response regulator transcription factor n=1 Tax=Xenophilus arseniciresistens TaxID=1283306 RepID=A0AAE3T020_9BURK|nr:response regulator transcription factor [Xenophilus arseniciresistens]MDA7416466.1 response regulator transcription factor [Xenophilus arseniciresistens]
MNDPSLAPLAASLREETAQGDLVLIVDDVPDNLAMLHDALDESGYTVLVATSGEAALMRAAQARPDIVLLDAMMPGMDGFEVARRLKGDAATAHIPIVFMTGLTETEHLVAALGTGAVDYVTKPIKPKEVLARMDVHLRGARHARQQAQQAGHARNALDAFGYASITVRMPEGRVIWQTSLARELLQRYAQTTAPAMPAAMRDWLAQHLPATRQGVEPPPLVLVQGAAELQVRVHQQTGDDDDDGAGQGDAQGVSGDWLLILREVSDGAAIEAMRLALKLTAREAEVLYWVAKGKTNKDIGDILGSSPATAKKHLERIYVKLGVETRTAAAAVALKRIRESLPQFQL